MNTQLPFLITILGFLLINKACAQSFTSSDLPIITITTDAGRTIVDDPKVLATLTVIDNGPGKRNNLADKPAVTSKIGIELRGSTSQEFFPKKPYGFELRDPGGVNSVNVGLLGMPEESDWVLNAVYNDRSLLREALTYDLNRKMSRYYTPRFRYCEVVLNGNYQGIYILFEKIKRDKNRVDIADLKKVDIAGDQLTGGYILKVDKFEGTVGESWQTSVPNINGKKASIQIDRPKREDLVQEQIAYIRNYVKAFETALAGPDFRDETKGYRKYFDDDAAVDYLLLTEICRNVDGYRISTFFYKDRDSKGGKLTLGPIWDYNLTYGNANYSDGEKPTGWAYNFDRISPSDYFQMPFWWDRLLKDPTFTAKVVQKYQAMRKTVLATNKIHAYVDSSATRLTEARIRNFQRWPIIGKTDLWPVFYTGRTYDDEVNYFKDWIRKRLDWMDGAMPLLSVGILATEPTDDLSLSVGPVPMTESATVRYKLSQRANVQLAMVDANGRSVFVANQTGQPAGEHTYALNANQLPSQPGVYVLTLQTDGQVKATQKVIKY
ncbi:MAG: T9SS C-terminal target domain-containing protein [Cytophagales bacterium]|nr:MAG: T9SS C-terminal target domain-containing protein [Cytophagales bacterium]